MPDDEMIDQEDQELDDEEKDLGLGEDDDSSDSGEQDGGDGGDGGDGKDGVEASDQDHITDEERAFIALARRYPGRTAEEIEQLALRGSYVPANQNAATAATPAASSVQDDGSDDDEVMTRGEWKREQLRQRHELLATQHGIDSPVMAAAARAAVEEMQRQYPSASLSECYASWSEQFKPRQNSGGGAGKSKPRGDSVASRIKRSGGARAASMPGGSGGGATMPRRQEKEQTKTPDQLREEMFGEEAIAAAAEQYGL